MNYAQLRKYDIANGEGIRTTLFVSGCRHNCDGCFNREYSNFNYGKEYTIETYYEIHDCLSDENVSGFSLLGGEPFMQDAYTLKVLLGEIKAHYPNKDIWVWTGYRLGEIPIEYHDVFQYIDVLIDGKFEQDKKDLKLKWRGSSNQRIWKKNESGEFYDASDLL